MLLQPWTKSCLAMTGLLNVQIEEDLVLILETLLANACITIIIL